MRALRAMANTLNDTVLIGKEGITDAVIAQTEEVMEKHELIKIKVLETAMMTAKEVQAELCDALDAEPGTVHRHQDCDLPRGTRAGKSSH